MDGTEGWQHMNSAERGVYDLYHYSQKVTGEVEELAWV